MLNSTELDDLTRRMIKAYESVDQVPWRTMDGREMVIGEMVDSHLNNALMYKKRDFDRYSSMVAELNEQIGLFPNSVHTDSRRDELDTLVDNVETA